MPNITWYDLPEGASLWPGLSLSLSGDEVIPLDYHAGHSDWLLYGRGPGRQRLTRYQSKLSAAMVIVTAWCMEDYRVIRLADSLTIRAMRLAHEVQPDVAPLGEIPHLRMPGLLVMDMDSTVVQIEYTDEVAKLVGANEMMVEVTGRAMRNELGFTASLYSRVAILKGADANILQQARKSLPPIPGLTQLTLKLGMPSWKMAIIFGGLAFFAEYLRDKLCLTAVVANELEIMDDKLTGNVIGDIVDAQYEAKALTRLAQEYEIPLAWIVVIGDGTNDLPMVKATRLGIAYHARSKVNEKAEITICRAGLMGIFCALSGSLNQKQLLVRHPTGDTALTGYTMVKAPKRALICNEYRTGYPC